MAASNEKHIEKHIEKHVNDSKETQIPRGNRSKMLLRMWAHLNVMVARNKQRGGNKQSKNDESRVKDVQNSSSLSAIEKWSTA